MNEATMNQENKECRKLGWGLILLLLMALAATLIFGGGCKSYPGDIQSFTSRVIGVDVSSGGTSGETPHLQIGFVSTTYHRVPTSTNGPISAPSVDSSIGLNQHSLNTDINEDFSVGDASTRSKFDTVARQNVTKTKANAKTPPLPSGLPLAELPKAQ